MPWYTKSISQTYAALHTTEAGLSGTQAKKRLKKYGKNLLPHAKNRTTLLKIFLDQWKSPLIIILVIAGIVSGLLEEFTDMILIFITVLVNASVGFAQEAKANKALEQLEQMITYRAQVLRDKKKVQISAEELVPGDIIYLEAGDKIQADGRIISYNEFTVKEAALTGESEPVKKTARTYTKELSLGDRKNMVFRGSIVIQGSAVVVVTDTGANTQIGKIAMLVKDTKDEQTPLQVQMSRLGKLLGVIVVSIAVLIFIIGIFFRSNIYGVLELFETAVAVAVAAIPEGLVISLTVILAIGMQRILKKNALVRKLVAAETLGSVSVIAVDKTGTLTEGNMTLTKIVTAENEYIVDATHTHQITPDILQALQSSIIVSNAVIDAQDDHTIFGDSTEVALLGAGLIFDIDKRQLDKTYTRLDEIPFDSKKKYMATLNETPDGMHVYCKGAPEVVLADCTHLLKDGKSVAMTVKMREKISKQLIALTQEGYRVLAVTRRDADNNTKNLADFELTNMVFLGFMCIIDPIRSEVKETLKIARDAGIRVVMITGDHADTARAIAKKIGLPIRADAVMTGQELMQLSKAQLARSIDRISVFARVEPEHKIQIVQAFQERGDVVAMTGDGVNDAPALKGADIGVALGSGSDVAKEISDVVLLDDSFSTIVVAVEEGRTIYHNIKKIVLYLMAGSSAEVILISLSLLMGLPLALLPAQILWVNIILDSFPNMALAFDRGEKEDMLLPPRKRNAPLIDHEMKVMILNISIISNIVLFSLYLYLYAVGNDIDHIRTIIFAALAACSLMYIYSVRSMRHHLWEHNLFDNKYLNGAILLGWVMLVLAIYVPPLQILLGTMPLNVVDWGLVLAFGGLNIVLIEIVKSILLVKNNKKKYAHD